MTSFDVAKAIFIQIDMNKDGSIDPNEFRKWIAASGGISGGGLSSSSSQSSSGLAFNSNNADLGEIGGTTGYEASYNSQSGFESTASLSSSSSEFAQTTNTNLSSNNLQYSSNDKIFQDPNPQILKRPAPGGVVTYQQKISVRFLQPPPVPPPGPLYIKEVRPAQPPPPSPLVIRQRAPPLSQPPPLILRERPPNPPAAVASQTITRRLAALPVPPRSVIIERLPPLPSKPRDIIIERWIGYGAQAKRRTIVQRAAAAKEYAKPRNLIIVYEPIQARIVRQFERLGVQQQNPQNYLSRYGISLLDASTLVQQARAAGVIEDISPPAGSQFSASSSSAAFDSSSSASFGQNFSSTDGEAAAFEGLKVVGDTDDSYSSQSFSSSSSYGGNVGGVTSGGSGFDFAAASFTSADTNHDGKLDRTEFERFVQGGL